MLGLGVSEGRPEGTFEWVQVGVEGHRSGRCEARLVQMQGQEAEEIVREVLVANLEEELVGLPEFHAGPQEALLGSAVADNTVEPVEGWVSV